MFAKIFTIMVTIAAIRFAWWLLRTAAAVVKLLVIAAIILVCIGVLGNIAALI